MAVKSQAPVALVKTVRERAESGREAALREIAMLRKDIGELEKILTGKRKKDGFSLFDVVHGAFEIFRNASTALDAEQLLLGIEEATKTATAEQYLLGHGASLWTKPAGWHWISPKGELYALGKAEDIEKAAAKLADLLPGKKRKPAKPESPAPQAEAGPSPEAGQAD